MGYPPPPVVGPKLAFFPTPPCQGRGWLELSLAPSCCLRSSTAQGLLSFREKVSAQLFRSPGGGLARSWHPLGPRHPSAWAHVSLLRVPPTAYPCPPFLAQGSRRVCHQLPCTSACRPPALGLSPGPSCISPSPSKRQTPTFIAGYSQKPKEGSSPRAHQWVNR